MLSSSAVSDYPTNALHPKAALVLRIDMLSGDQVSAGFLI